MSDLTYVLPVRNGEAYLADALGSLVAQTHKGIEIIVVNDGSTAATEKIIEFYVSRDKRVKSAKMVAKSSGAARNLGCEMALSDAIAVLDADDIADCDRTKNTLKALEKAEFVYGPATLIDVLGRPGQSVFTKFDLERALKEKMTRIVHSTVAFKKSLWEKYKFDEGEYTFNGVEDWHQQMRMALDGVAFEASPKVLSAVRVTNLGVTGTRDHKKVHELKEAFLAAQKQAA